MKKNNLSHSSSGFTIVELLMAAAVFSLVLLVAIIGFIQVGKMFYKSIETGKTNDTASNILESVTSDLRSIAPGDPAPDFGNLFASPPAPSSVGNNWGYDCIASHRYTFFLSQYPIPNPSPNIVNISAGVTSSTRVGLIRDDINKGNCASPQQADGSMSWNNPQQMLGDGMSLGKFYITLNSSAGVGTSIYKVAIIVGFGDNSNSNDISHPTGVFSYLNDPDSGPGVAADKLHCRGALGTNFCAVSSLDTFVTSGLSIQ